MLIFEIININIGICRDSEMISGSAQGRKVELAHPVIVSYTSSEIEIRIK